jgi:hypothetical protein
MWYGFTFETVHVVINTLLIEIVLGLLVYH